MYNFWVHVYNFENPLGSFYTTSSKRVDIVNEINAKYGENNWTRFTFE